MAYRTWSDAVVDRGGGRDWVASAAPSIVPDPVGWPQAGWSRRERPHLPRCPEIDCVRHLLPQAVLARAELRAVEAGIGADRALIAAGAIGEEDYVAALASHLGVPCEPLHDRSRGFCPLPDARLIEAANVGILPLDLDNDLEYVVAPRLVDCRRLLDALREFPGLRSRIRLTTAARLRDFVMRESGDEIARRAIDELPDKHPELSARATRGNRRRRIAAGAALAATLVLAPGIAVTAIEIALGIVFLAWAALRLFGLLSERLARHQPRTISDERLPTYTIVAALYREAAAVSGLVASLQRLRYPVEKLNVIFVLEADDWDTYHTIAAMRLDAPFEIMFAPLRGPRTKPKALNAALPFARGSFVAIYDAEDRPEPDQLRRALEAFVAGDARLACVQARLTIDNTADSWLARLFTAEYAGLFDVFLPGLAAWRLPLPLGGSSNHFRTAILREAGAWDPYNVTEDADLGMRLARLGYCTSVIASTTYEEAPARFLPWLKQRTRWFKGWLQTWLVHMRSPLLLARQLGVPGFIVFQLLAGGTVLAALVHPLFVFYLAWEIAHARVGAMPSIAAGFYAAALAAGYLISAVLGLIGLARRRLLGCAWVLLLMPLYWLLLSLAAWRAVLHLLRDPHRWEKTEHGLARHSRLAHRLTGSAADRRPPPAATA